MPEIIAIAIICKEYSWTYDDYMDAPAEFTDAIRARRLVENALKKEEYDKLNAQS